MTLIVGGGFGGARAHARASSHGPSLMMSPFGGSDPFAAMFGSMMGGGGFTSMSTHSGGGGFSQSVEVSVDGSGRQTQTTTTNRNGVVTKTTTITHPDGRTETITHDVRARLCSPLIGILSHLSILLFWRSLEPCCV